MGKTAFTDGDPTNNVLGTLITAEFLNAIQNHRHDGLDQDGSAPLDYIASTGSANAYVLTLTKALTAHIAGLPIRFKANFTNTGAATINISGLGAIAIRKRGTVALSTNDIVSGQIVTVAYDGTYYQIQGVDNPTLLYAADSGSANAYVLTLSPALAAHVVGQPIMMLASNANTGTSTININSLGAVTIVRPDGTVLQAGDIPAGALVALAYSGTYYQLLTVFPALQRSSVRQTVQGGPVDTSGYPSFLPSTSTSLSLTSQSITASAPLVVSAANGFNKYGEVNNIGVSTANLTWADLVASSTLYLYVTVANGILTTGYTNLVPIYQWGGTPSVTAGQATYNIQAGKMYLGDGTSANETNLVFVGEAITGTSAVSSTVAYAYNGRYDSGWTSTLPSSATVTSKNHNIGTTKVFGGIRLKCLAANGNYSIDDVINSPVVELSSSGIQAPAQVIVTSRNACQFNSGASGSFSYQANKTTGAQFAPTAASWAYEVYMRREF